MSVLYTSSCCIGKGIILKINNIIIKNKNKQCTLKIILKKSFIEQCTFNTCNYKIDLVEIYVNDCIGRNLIIKTTFFQKALVCY